MLRTMRSNAKWIFYILAIAFIGWLAIGQVMSILGPSGNVVLRVNRKEFPVTERIKLQFRTEFFNIFNRVNYLAPNQSNQVDSVGSAGFGSIRAAMDPRIGQLALKVIW